MGIASSSEPAFADLSQLRAISDVNLPSDHYFALTVGRAHRFLNLLCCDLGAVDHDPPSPPASPMTPSSPHPSPPSEEFLHRSAFVSSQRIDFYSESDVDPIVRPSVGSARQGFYDIMQLDDSRLIAGVARHATTFPMVLIDLSRPAGLQIRFIPYPDGRTSSYSDLDLAIPRRFLKVPESWRLGLGEMDDDGNEVVPFMSCNDNGSLSIWNTKEENLFNPIATIKPEDMHWARSIALSETDRTIFFAGEAAGGCVTVDFDRWEQTGVIVPNDSDTSPFQGIEYCEETNLLLLSRSTGQLYRFDHRSPRQIQKSKQTKSTTSVRCVPDQPLVCCLGSGGNVCCWDSRNISRPLWEDIVHHRAHSYSLMRPFPRTRNGKVPMISSSGGGANAVSVWDSLTGKIMWNAFECNWRGDEGCCVLGSETSFERRLQKESEEERFGFLFSPSLEELAGVDPGQCVGGVMLRFETGEEMCIFGFVLRRDGDYT